MNQHNTANIDASANCITLVNVYDVEPANQAELARRLSEVTQATIRHQPGFLSVSIHSSHDGKKVVNYAQWTSKAHFESFMKQPETQQQLQQFATLATSVTPALYRVDVVHTTARDDGSAK